MGNAVQAFIERLPPKLPIREACEVGRFSLRKPTISPVRDSSAWSEAAGGPTSIQRRSWPISKTYQRSRLSRQRSPHRRLSLAAAGLIRVRAPDEKNSPHWRRGEGIKRLCTQLPY